MPPFVDRAECLRPLVGAIIWLVIAHLAAAVTLGTCVRYDSEEVGAVLFVGLVFAQAGLLGFWCAL